MYAEAIGGDKDAIQGYAFLRAAVKLGVPSSMTTIALDELDAAAAQLDARQRAEAQRLAIRLSVSASTRTAPLSGAADQAPIVAAQSVRVP
jgi:hypothetical protein